jgi:hypothetical protein
MAGERAQQADLQPPYRAYPYRPSKVPTSCQQVRRELPTRDIITLRATPPHVHECYHPLGLYTNDYQPVDYTIAELPDVAQIACSRRGDSLAECYGSNNFPDLTAA